MSSKPMKELDNDIKDFVELNLSEDEGADFLALLSGKDYTNKYRLFVSMADQIKKKRSLEGRSKSWKVGKQIRVPLSDGHTTHDPQTGEMWSCVFKNSHLVKKVKFREKVNESGI